MECSPATDLRRNCGPSQGGRGALGRWCPYTDPFVVPIGCVDSPSHSLIPSGRRIAILVGPHDEPEGRPRRQQELEREPSSTHTSFRREVSQPSVGHKFSSRGALVTGRVEAIFCPYLGQFRGVIGNCASGQARSIVRCTPLPLHCRSSDYNPPPQPPRITEDNDQDQANHQELNKWRATRTKRTAAECEQEANNHQFVSQQTRDHVGEISNLEFHTNSNKGAMTRTNIENWKILTRQSEQNRGTHQEISRIWKIANLAGAPRRPRL